MKITDRLPSLLVITVLVAGIGIAGWRIFAPPADSAIVKVNVPDLSQAATVGKTAFDSNCAQCHGRNAAGSDKGPPLVHDIYNPGHHADASFYFAAQRGVQRHHWYFGNMPSQPQLSRKDMAAIISYVRELQQANGIFYKEHRM